jgi:hypothetical protein
VTRSALTTCNLDAARRVLSPRDLDAATRRALSTCNLDSARQESGAPRGGTLQT